MIGLTIEVTEMKDLMMIPKQVTHGDELVVMPRQAYDRLRKHLTEIEDALAKIRRGEAEYRAGKTRVVGSLADLRR